MQQVPMGCGWFGGFFRDEDSGSGDGGGGDEAPSLYRGKHWLDPSLGPHDMYVNVDVTQSFFGGYGKKTTYLIITVGAVMN